MVHRALKTEEMDVWLDLFKVCRPGWPGKARFAHGAEQFEGGFTKRQV